MSFSLNEIVRYEFGTSSYIKDIEGDVKGISIDPQGFIDISKLNEQSPVSVYGIDGAEHPFILRDKVIDISGLMPGIYVIRIGNTSFRMLKQ